MVKNAVFALSALALASAPALAQSALAPSMAPMTGEELGAEGASSALLGVVAAGLIIGGIIVASDNDSAPVSR